MISTARWVPPWQVVQRPQHSSSQKARKNVQRSSDAGVLVEEDDAAAAEEHARARGRGRA